MNWQWSPIPSTFGHSAGRPQRFPILSPPPLPPCNLRSAFGQRLLCLLAASITVFPSPVLSSATRAKHLLFILVRLAFSNRPLLSIGARPANEGGRRTNKAQNGVSPLSPRDPADTGNSAFFAWLFARSFCVLPPAAKKSRHTRQHDPPQQQSRCGPVAFSSSKSGRCIKPSERSSCRMKTRPARQRR